MKRSLLIGVFFLACFIAQAQDFQNTFDRFNGSYIPERIHIHYDKTSYAAGDTIWFKAYVMQGTVPTALSKSLYIDWTDKDGKMITRSFSPIVGGSTFGQVAIPVEYNSTFIHARAYTRWMLNFDSSFLYNKDLHVLSANKSKSANETVRTLFNVFPESGNLVEGLNNKIAFKATDTYGRPVKVKGNILVNGSPSGSFNTVHDGMGFFFLNPIKGRTYSVSWQDSTGTKHSMNLPAVMPKGLILQLKDNDKNKIFSVQNNDSTVQTIHMIGTMYQQQVFNITRTLNSGVTQGIIPTESLPSGILTVTVLNQDFQPMAERITFINNEEYKFETEMNVAHWGLNKRAKDEIEITIPEGMTASLSVSVTDNAIDFDTTSSIVTSLLLSSELKGKIFNPAFYFSENDSAGYFLDLVMLTNGWRKISWADLAKGKLPAITFNPDTTYQTVSGKIYGATPVQLSNAGDIVLIINQKNQNEWLSAPIKRDGTFEVGDYMLFDTATVYFQPPKNKLLQQVSVQFMEDKLPVQSTVKAGTGHYIMNTDTSGASRHALLSEAMQDELKFFGGKVLEDVTIVARTKSPEEKLDETYASGLFSGSNGKGFDLRNDPVANAYQNIFQYLQGRVAGVNITMSQPPSITWRGGAPALFLNEMQVDADMLSTIPVSDIAYVKVLNPPFVGAVGGGGNGAIAIYTRKGGDVQMDPGKGLSKNTLTGYSMIRQFYSPDYERSKDEKKDLRTTLYWNPEVILTPQNNKTILKFFNNDVSEAFRVVIEGMSTDGKLTRLVQIME